MLGKAEQLVHLPRGHGEALTDACSNLYSEMGIAIAARHAGLQLPNGHVDLPDVLDGARGVAFVQACVDSNLTEGDWRKLEDYFPEQPFKTVA